MTAELIRAKRNSSEVQSFTLIFKNGCLLKNQSALTLAQFCSDARLAGFKVERDNKQHHLDGVVRLERASHP
ncbi:hypothetical protein C7K08_07620 [Synechococcus lacustris str. Tous]|uniref:Uncharacterized protein n=1 Tax=Synechococcus lacustris str. Tous TaxID=1910958 RepID=A0A2P7EE35_9SYNE|nr:hypothetical protein C7K08_07620 [Synechococcus lacustris str. Tous]